MTTGRPVAMREHGTRARYLKGPDENDQPGPCRCTPCGLANNAEKRNVYRMKAYGRWQPYVDATPVRTHVEELVRQGLKPKRIATLAGVAQPTVDRLLYGFPNRSVQPSSKVRTATAEALLAVRMALEGLPAQARLDATGTRRRVQALIAMGWSLTRLAERAGISRTNFTLLIRAQGVRADTARKVRALYDDLWNQAPPTTSRRDRISVTRTREWAQENDWAPPLAWDDDTIDDPAAVPDLGATSSRQDALFENSEELLRQEFTVGQAAERLGISRNYLEQIRTRASKAAA